MAFNYEYYFEKEGKTRNDHTDINNEIWLDIGGDIEVGTFDYHNCAKGYISTVDVLVHELDLLERTRETLDPSQAVRIYLHINPDVDVLFASYYLKFFFDNGRKAFTERFLNNTIGKIIENYVNDIGSGTRKNIDGITLYNLVCHLDIESVTNYWSTVNEVELSNKIMIEALGWVEQAIDSIEENGQFNLYDWDLPVKEDDVIAKKISESVMEIKKYNYNRDKIEGRLTIKDISIWIKDGKAETVKAAIWKDVPLSPSSAYIYARKEGAIVTFVPHNEYGNNAARISINPNIDGAVDKYSLTEVAEIYEQMEQIYDRHYLDRTGSLKRNYSRPRGNENCKVFLKKPFSMTSDPWYVSVKGDMVDAPGNGSLIPVDVMIEILENITKMVKKTYLINLDLNLEHGVAVKETMIERTYESLLSWTKYMRQKLSDIHKDMYTMVITEVDASLISHNYDILDAYFMSISDGAYVDGEDKNVLHFDYRTHLYVNQSNAVLFVATSKNTTNDLQMKGMLSWSDENDLKNSRIVNVFLKILYQREKFKEIGKFLGKFGQNDKEIKKKYDELIVLLTEAQADECIDSQVELDVFNFVYDALNVSSLRESVEGTMNLVSEYSKERVYANLNFLSLITIPFIVLSTLFQMGVFRFKPLLDFDTESNTVPDFLPWSVFLIVVVILTAVFLFKRKK